MHPISQIELNAHFRDLERQVATARRSQGVIARWLGRLWHEWRPTAPVAETAPTSSLSMTAQ